MKHLFRIMGITALLAAVCVFIGGIAGYMEELDQRDWTVTIARVTDVSSRVKSSGTGRRSSSRTVYDISYSYEAAGRTYAGQIKGTGQMKRVGDEFRVKYDPENPADATAVLSPMLSHLLVPLLGGLGFGTFGFFASGLWKLFRRGKMGKSPAA